jgi:hypothetical protein
LEIDKESQAYWLSISEMVVGGLDVKRTWIEDAGKQGTTFTPSDCLTVPPMAWSGRSSISAM